MAQLAAVFTWFDAIGVAIPGLIGIKSLLEGRGVPLLVLFLLILVAELPAGWLLWQGERLGALLALALLVPDAIFWWGFDLPYPPLIAIGSVAAIALAWNSLRG